MQFNRGKILEAHGSALQGMNDASSLSWSPDGQQLAAAAKNSERLVIWDTVSGDIVKSTRLLQAAGERGYDAIYSLGYGSYRERALLAVLTSFGLYYHVPAAGLARYDQLLHGCPGALTGLGLVAWDASGQQMAVIRNRDSQVLVVEPGTFEVMARTEVPMEQDRVMTGGCTSNEVVYATFYQEGRSLMLVCRGGAFYLWSLNQDRLRLIGHMRAEIRLAALSPDERYLAIAGAQGWGMVLHEMDSGEFTGERHYCNTDSCGLAWYPTGQVLTILHWHLSGYSTDVSFIDATTGETLSTIGGFSPDCSQLEFSPLGDRLAVSGGHSRLIIEPEYLSRAQESIAVSLLDVEEALGEHYASWPRPSAPKPRRRPDSTEPGGVFIPSWVKKAAAGQ